MLRSVYTDNVCAGTESGSGIDLQAEFRAILFEELEMGSAHVLFCELSGARTQQRPLSYLFDVLNTVFKFGGHPMWVLFGDSAPLPPWFEGKPS